MLLNKRKHYMPKVIIFQALTFKQVPVRAITL